MYVDAKPYCDTVVLDRVRNSRRKRKPLRAAEETPTRPAATPGLDPLGLICAEHDRRIRPPAPRAMATKKNLSLDKE